MNVHTCLHDALIGASVRESACVFLFVMDCNRAGCSMCVWCVLVFLCVTLRIIVRLCVFVVCLFQCVCGFVSTALQKLVVSRSIASSH